MLYSTAWHPQTDDISERSNQTAEIALRYFIELMDNHWPKALPQLSSILNNSTKYSTTRLAPNEIIFGFKVKEPLNMLAKASKSAEASNKALIPSFEGLHNQATESTLIPFKNSTKRATESRIKGLPNQAPTAFTINYRPTHIDAQDTIDFASIRIKEYYNSHHQPMFFNVGDLVKLRLHRGYKVPEVSSKFGQQFVGPFKVLERIGRLAYRL